jgi:hypothetical protein
MEGVGSCVVIGLGILSLLYLFVGTSHEGKVTFVFVTSRYREREDVDATKHVECGRDLATRGTGWLSWLA